MIFEGSALGQINMMESMIVFFLDAGGKEKVLQTESGMSMCFIYFQVRISLHSISLFTLPQEDVYFNTGYWRWPPNRPVRCPPPDGALVCANCAGL